MSVSVRELKVHLSEYLRRAQRGETLDVTSRGEVVARLVPAPSSESALEALRAQPWVITGQAGASFGLDMPVKLRGVGPSLSELLLEDRG